MEKIFEVQSIKQVIRETEYDKVVIRSPQDAFHLMAKEIAFEDREVFLVACLSTKNEVVGFHRCHVGSLNASIVSPREVFKMAILNNSASIIVGHNHPSYDPTPSKEDITVTKRLVDCGRILGIEVLDHLIIGGDEKFISLHEKGYMG